MEPQVREDVLGGEPTFPETRIAIRHIGAMLLNNVPREEIKSDYPNLTDEDLEFAKDFLVKDIITNLEQTISSLEQTIDFERQKAAEAVHDAIAERDVALNELNSLYPDEFTSAREFIDTIIAENTTLTKQLADLRGRLRDIIENE